MLSTKSSLTSYSLTTTWLLRFTNSGQNHSLPTTHNAYLTQPGGNATGWSNTRGRTSTCNPRGKAFFLTKGNTALGEHEGIPLQSGRITSNFDQLLETDCGIVWESAVSRDCNRGTSIGESLYPYNKLFCQEPQRLYVGVGWGWRWSLAANQPKSIPY